MSMWKEGAPSVHIGEKMMNEVLEVEIQRWEMQEKYKYIKS